MKVAGMESALRAKPLDARERYELQLKVLQEAYVEVMLELPARKNGVLAGQGRQVIETIRQGLKKDGFDVAVSKTCAWFGIARRSAYYKPVNAEPKVQECFAEPVRKIILEEPSFGYRMVVGLLGFNKNTVHRFFLLKGRRVKKRPIGFRPSVKALPSVATGPDRRWATDLCRIWTGCEGWAVLALVIDCYTWELLG